MQQHLLPRLLAAITCTTLASAQDVLAYKFDSRTAPTALNFAARSGLAPAEGTARYGTSPWTWTDGRFGPAALKHSPYGGLGANYVDTGWTGALQGDATFAFWARNGLANSTAEVSGFLGRDRFSLATGGPAGGGLTLSGWGGPDLVAAFGVDLCAMPGWNHFAVVIDATARTATWYRNGVPTSTVPVAGGVALAGSLDTMKIGVDHQNWCGSLYDIDEVIVANRAASAAQVRQWATADTAADAAFGNGTQQTTLTTAGGTPALGNAQYRLEVGGAANASFAVVLGGQRTHIELAGLLGPGGALFTLPAVALPGRLDEQGRGQLPLPVPELPALDHAVAFSQAIVMLPAGGFAASNGIAHALAAR